MNILFIDNHGIGDGHLKYLREVQPRQIEGNRQYILFLARNLLKKHNVLFPFQDGDPDIAHVFDGFSQPIFFKKKLTTVYSLLQPPICKTKAIRQFPLFLSERAGLDMLRIGLLGLIPQSLFCRYFKKFDKVLTVTNYEREFLIKNGIPEEKIDRLGVGVDYNFFRPQKVDRDEDIFIVSYFGAVSAFKGIDIVYKTIKFFKEDKGIKFRLALDLYSQRHSGILKKLKKLKNVEIFGHIGDIRDFLSSSDLLFLPFPSMLGNFSIPFTLLEAMSTGTLVLTTNLPPLKEVVKDEKTGFICEIGEFKRKINWIRDNKDGLNHIKRNARKFIVKNCDWEKIAKKLMMVYEEVSNG